MVKIKPVACHPVDKHLSECRCFVRQGVFLGEPGQAESFNVFFDIGSEQRLQRRHSGFSF
jgi:hypothetical protein